MVDFKKKTRYEYQVANQMGETLTKTADYSLTADNILQSGNQFIKLSNNANLTLPPAIEDLRGIVVRVMTTSQGMVSVAAGFGGGGASYDTSLLSPYQTADFWCDGDFWYCKAVDVTAAASSSSSSSSST